MLVAKMFNEQNGWRNGELCCSRQKKMATDTNTPDTDTRDTGRVDVEP